MNLEIDFNWAVPATVSVVSLVGGLYARTIRMENKALHADIANMKESHQGDMRRMDAAHDDMWEEIKVQREALAQNKEAVIRLSASIDKLNEILPILERTISNGVSRRECDAKMSFGRRITDKINEDIDQ